MKPWPGSTQGKRRLRRGRSDRVGSAAQLGFSSERSFFSLQGCAQPAQGPAKQRRQALSARLVAPRPHKGPRARFRPRARSGRRNFDAMRWLIADGGGFAPRLFLVSTYLEQVAHQLLKPAACMSAFGGETGLGSAAPSLARTGNRFPMAFAVPSRVRLMR